MRGAPSRQHRTRLGSWAAVVAIAAMPVLGPFSPAPATAQPLPGSDLGSNITMPVIAPDEKMLVESDQLVYDYDNETVSAVGNVRIYYAGFTLEAERVTYDQRTGRLIAVGNVQLVEPSGARFYSDYFDITDDFRDGFVESLRVETPDETYFTAARAERSGGDTTTFFDSTYTACEPCRENPGKPLLWNVKAKKIIIDHSEQMVYFTDARLEFFGLPMVYLPYFAVPDPSVQRKTGWLAPAFGYEDRLGVYVSTPYYWAPAPNYDITFAPTIYTRQGLLADVEWRHRLAHGSYTIRAAGIHQMDPDAFAGTDGDRTLRGGLRTTGEFFINQDWTFGWDGTVSSDRAFTRNYDVLNTDTSETISTVHLTGIGDRNYFEARASHYEILTDTSAGDEFEQNRQGYVAPVIDYHKIADYEVLGGELSYTTNFANVLRAEDDPFEVGAPPEEFFHGTAGTQVRGTQEIAWQNRIVGPMGQVITPFAWMRGDAFFLAGQTPEAIAGGLTPDSSAYRFMPAIGAEWSWPILARAGEDTHIFEPIAQIIARPNEMHAGTLPNNDAQSLVFDVSNLFDHNKFSGFDRVEGGTRANIGIRYYGAFASGASLEGAFGQSIHLAGVNPYNPIVSDELSNVGAASGLETNFSDYVAGVTLDSGLGPRVSARARFDEKSFSINRAELQATSAIGPVTASANYIYLRTDPNSGLMEPSSAIRAAASVNFAENWRAFGSVTYDVEKSAFAGDSFGIAYDDECLTLSIAYSQTHEGYTDLQPTRALNFRLQLRTLGETSYSQNLNRL
jgi:LPS-assembly protein